VGNVRAGAVDQLMGGATAQSVSNPRAAEGGADGELPAAVLGRGPHALRHRRQALSLSDYEDLAREASPAVAVARALPATHPSGRPAPGWVKVIVIPHGQEPRPVPSFGLRRQVQRFLAARAPAAVAAQIVVGAPDYLPIGVQAVVAPLDPTAGGEVFAAATEALMAFLHPLTGGPDGEGWPFGRDVFLSDVAAVLERTPGVDYVETLNLLLDGTPRGESVQVPPDRIVVAGPLRLTLAGSED
jgi:predicted phage baseplate assembly protein